MKGNLQKNRKCDSKILSGIFVKLTGKDGKSSHKQVDRIIYTNFHVYNICIQYSSLKLLFPTCTPRMPKMMKNAQQMRTMLPMGLREVMRVSTTSLRPGALLITLKRDEQ